jgi:hypothetical protein
MARLPLAARTRRRNMALRNILTSIVVMYYYIWLLMALVYRRKCLKIENFKMGCMLRDIFLNFSIRWMN